MDEAFCFSVRTSGDTNPAGKPRVYFTCHPSDWRKSFDRICRYVFAAQDCAIYFKADMRMDIPDENREVDLERMSLFIIPVSSSLLKDNCFAMDADYSFAMKKHIPVLPILLEPVDSKLYEAKFGSLQYLNPESKDKTEIPFEEKLKKYLMAVLISDEEIKRVRDAFDAYIFLSYRKKDRLLANDLLRLIHSKKELRAVAVWYDEFLTPGESFNENINRILNDSALFTLLVTPNLLEDNNGKPNYVMQEEYPAAKKSGVEIIPVEIDSDNYQTGRILTSADRDILESKFDGIPASIHLHAEDEEFLSRLQRTIYRNAIRESEDPIHNYLIGLAYLDGIDVEVNYEYAVRLFKSADEAGIIEASKKLSQMYFTGQGVEYDVFKAAEYENKVLNFLRQCETTIDNKRKLVQELVYMGDICGSGKTEKIEPSPGKLLSVAACGRLYYEAVLLQEEIMSESKEVDTSDLLALRHHLSIICRVLSSLGWKRYSDCSKEDVVLLCQKYVRCAEVIAEDSQQFDDLYLYRESLKLLLGEMNPYDGDIYDKTLIKAVAVARKTCNHTAAGPGDYYQLLDIIRLYGIGWYRANEKYDSMTKWIHEFYEEIGLLKQILSRKPRVDRYKEYKSTFESLLNLVGKDLVNLIFYITVGADHPNVTLAIYVLAEVEKNTDDYDFFMRDYLIPSAKEMVKTVSNA